VVHLDICGPMETLSLNGERYFITFTDETSGRVSINLLHSKDQALASFQAYSARAEKVSGKEIKSLRSDGGGEYMNNQFKKYLENAGIQHRVTPPYSPSQNGLAERMNRTLVESGRCMLADSKLEKRFWGPAVLTAAHVHNRVPSRSHGDISPLQHWTGQLPGIGHLRVFGSTTWVHVPKEKRLKLDPKSVKCLLIGYEEETGSKIYRLYDPIRKAEIRSRDVIINEAGSGPEQVANSNPGVEISWEPEPVTVSPNVSDDRDNNYQEGEPITPPSGQQVITPNSDVHDSITVRPIPFIEHGTRRPGETPAEAAAESGSLERPELRRSHPYRRPGESFPSQAHFALMANTLEVDPQTLGEARRSVEKVRWEAAWNSELDSLTRNNTWVLEPLPPLRTPIWCRWIFRKKDDGRFKARLVAKGFGQKYGIDYEETFAPVAKFTTIRLLLALSCEYDWEVQGMDVKTVFLNSELEEVVYMEVPEGVSIPRSEESNGHQRPIVCRLLKSIYGLKQSPRAWYGRIYSFFRSKGFVRSQSDHSLFISHEHQVILLLYVDDIVLAAPTTNPINWIRLQLPKEFDMTDLGD